MDDNSILNTIKKQLGLDEGYDAFDLDVTVAINSALGTLTQVGVGPPTGFQIKDDAATWDDLLGGDKRLGAVKTYIYQKTRLIFDPPATSFAITAIEKMLDEDLWRLNVAADPAPPLPIITTGLPVDDALY